MNPEYRGLSQREIMRRCIKKYRRQFYAEHPTRPARPTVVRSSWPNPVHIDHTFSGVLTRGTRVWAFATVEARDQFLADWSLARASEEPRA